MIDCEYYLNYYGPELITCILDTADVTDLVRDKYGNNNWNGKLWTFEEIFGKKCLNKNFRCEFFLDREHWFEGTVDKLDNYINVPLHTPMNQNTEDDYVIIKL